MNANRRKIYDDAADSIHFTGDWQHSANDHWAHGKTMTSSKTTGDTLRFEFTGRRLIWFARLAPECGRT